VVVIPGHMHPGSQPLPKVEPFLVTLLRMILPEPPMAGRFDVAKLEEIKKGFKPKSFADGTGCMLAAYNVLGILYGDKFSDDLMKEVQARAKDAADKGRNTKLFKQKVEKAMADNPNLSEAQARQLVWNKWHSANNTSDHTYALLAEKGLADDKVNTLNKDADQAVRNMTPKEPGAYFFGMAVRDTHTVTLAVKVDADGKQTMYWLDQTAPGLSTEIKPGKLGEALQTRVFDGTNSTNIYPLRPPAVAKP
jgi:hypothetical protein